MTVIRVREEWKEKVLLEYLLAICQTPQMIENIQREATGTGVQHIKIGDIESFPIPVPSLEEQNKIILGLNKIKQSIQNAQQIVNNLNVPVFVSLMKPVKTEKLGDVASFEYGYTISASDRGEFRFIRITDIDDYGEISNQEKKYIDLANEADKEKYLLKKGGIIVARIGATVGKTALFESQEKSIVQAFRQWQKLHYYQQLGKKNEFKAQIIQPPPWKLKN